MVTAEVDLQGNIHVPEEYGIEPREKVIISRVDDGIVVRKVKKELATKIKEMTTETFKTVDWKEIEQEREDRKW